VKVLREGFGGLAGDGDAADDDAAFDVDDDPVEEDPTPKVPSFTKDLRSLLEIFLVAPPPPPPALLLLPLPKTAFRVFEDDNEEAKTNGCFVFGDDDDDDDEEKKPKLPVDADLRTDSSRRSRISATSRVRSMICSGVYPASKSICVLVLTERTILRRAAFPQLTPPPPPPDDDDRSIAEDETILREAVIFRNCS